MFKKLKKAISIFLILITLFGRGIVWSGPVFAEDPAPTAVQESSSPAPEPTSEPAQTQTTSSTPTPDLQQMLNNQQALIDQSMANVQNKLGAITPTVAVNSQPSPTVSTGSGTDTGNATGDTSSADPGLTVSPTDGVTPTGEEGTGVSYSSTNVNDPANTFTGPYSTNLAQEKIDKQTEIINNSLAEVQNKVDAISSSGFNYANLNTLPGQVFTGDSLSQINLLNKLNSNTSGVGGFAVFNVLDTYVGDVVFKMAEGNADESFDSASPTVSKNVLTGPGSENIADASNTFTVKEANGNDAKLTNDINLESVTGGNSASFNTGGGVVSTGDAFAYGNIVNMANTNLNVSKWLIGVVNIFGTLAGNIILPQEEGTSQEVQPAGVVTANENTGPASTNIATFNNESSNVLENSNTAEITNNLDAQANSGKNTASANTGGGYVQTGDSSTAVSNSTVANVNTTNEDTVWMIIVNEAGKWVGKIVGSPWGATTASNSLPISQETSGAGTATYNTNTGPLSYNEATYNATSDTSVTNNNTAQITNNITGLSDSGNNQASYNTGAGIIETGDAKLGLNLVNMVNTNVTAKKFVAVLVNVMGNFLGDVVPPGQESVPVANWQGLGTNNYVLPQSTNSNEADNSNPPNSDSSSQTAGNTGENLPNIGFVPETPDNVTGVSTSSPTSQAEVYYTYYYVTNEPNNSDAAAQFSTPQYNQAAVQVNQARVNVKTKGRQLLSGIPIGVNSAPTQKVYYRGIFLSPAFAKAVETSSGGILLGGMSYKVNQSWLSIVPVALIIILLRRRKRININFTKYLNTLLDVVL